MSNITIWRRPDLSVWPTFGRLFGLPDGLEQLLDNPLTELTRTSRLLNVWNPAVDLYEDKDNFTVKAEVPGLRKEDIDVSLEDGVLTISGERKTDQKLEGAETHRAERFIGLFQRSLALPAEVKADEVKAQYHDGILTITLPKSEAAKPKQIEVKVD